MNESPLLNDRTLAVFGAAGKFWSTNSKHIAPLFDRTLPVDPKLRTGLPARDAVHDADAILISVNPEGEIGKICHEVLDLLQGKILLENLTTKDIPVLQRFRDAGAQICSLHTLIRTDSDHEGHTVLVMPFDEQCEDAKRVAVEMCEALRMHIEFLSVHVHNDVMALLQFSGHLLCRADTHARQVASALLEVPEEKLRGLETASGKLSSLARDRINVQEPHVSAHIVWSALKTEIGRTFLQSFRHFLLGVEQAASEEKLTNFFSEEEKTLCMTKERKQRILMTTDSVLAHLKHVEEKTK